MDIAQYISDLLTRHEEVGLPGIGTFFKRKISARFNSADGMYYPVSNVIDFKDEDGSSVLIEHIVATKHISQSSANYFIERFSENIKNSLERSSRAEIAPLGTLLKTDKGYSLESAAVISDLNYFGLKPVKEPEIIGKARVDHPQAPAQAVEDEAPRRSSLGIWIALFLLLLLAALGGLAYFYYPQYFKELNFSPNKQPKKKVVAPVAKPDPVRDSISFADSIVSQLEKQGMTDVEVEKAKDTATAKISSKAAPASDTLTLKATTAPAKHFEIIVSASNIKSEAERYVRSLRKKGIDAKVIIDERKPLYKVSAGSFTTMQVASKELQRIKRDIKKDAWILIVNNKENQ